MYITLTTIHAFNDHITIDDSMQDNVTPCMWYLNVNSKFHRFPIQYLESKPRFRSGQDQSPTSVSNEGSPLNTTPNPN